MPSTGRHSPEESEYLRMFMVFRKVRDAFEGPPADWTLKDQVKRNRQQAILHTMTELNIEEMASLRGGQAIDISKTGNDSNIAIILALGNQAATAPMNQSVGGGVTQVAAAQAGNQTVQLSQFPF
jgi:hypothetical protein